jgi:hypothetical protein
LAWQFECFEGREGKEIHVTLYVCREKHKMIPRWRRRRRMQRRKREGFGGVMGFGNIGSGYRRRWPRRAENDGNDVGHSRGTRRGFGR